MAMSASGTRVRLLRKFEEAYMALKSLHESSLEEASEHLTRLDELVSRNAALEFEKDALMQENDSLRARVKELENK